MFQQNEVTFTTLCHFHRYEQVPKSSQKDTLEGKAGKQHSAEQRNLDRFLFKAVVKICNIKSTI